MFRITTSGVSRSGYQVIIGCRPAPLGVEFAAGPARRRPGNRLVAATQEEDLGIWSGVFEERRQHTVGIVFLSINARRLQRHSRPYHPAMALYLKFGFATTAAADSSPAKPSPRGGRGVAKNVGSARRTARLREAGGIDRRRHRRTQAITLEQVEATPVRCRNQRRKMITLIEVRKDKIPSAAFVRLSQWEYRPAGRPY